MLAATVSGLTTATDTALSQIIAASSKRIDLPGIDWISLKDQSGR
jgi:hypothetical protein